MLMKNLNNKTKGKQIHQKSSFKREGNNIIHTFKEDTDKLSKEPIELKGGVREKSRKEMIKIIVKEA